MRVKTLEWCCLARLHLGHPILSQTWQTSGLTPVPSSSSGQGNDNGCTAGFLGGNSGVARGGPSSTTLRGKVRRSITEHRNAKRSPVHTGEEKIDPAGN